MATSVNCWVAYTFDSSVTEQKCYGYYYDGGTCWSRAQVYSGLVTVDLPGGNVSQQPASQRRECYSDAVGDCNFTDWNGW
jgi:hypothetical protein